MTLEEYIEQHSSPENEALAEITRQTNIHVLNPHMLSGLVQGRVLSFISQMIRPKRILELGTFTGYSALCLAEGLTEDGELITIEHNDELEETIRHNLSLSPLGSKIHLVIADAKKWLNEQINEKYGPYSEADRLRLQAEIRNDQMVNEYDLVFVDADKREYNDYFKLVLPLVRVGGWILADNTLWDGHIIDPTYDKDKQTLGLRAFNEAVASCADVEQVILPLRDGLTLIHKLR